MNVDRILERLARQPTASIDLPQFALWLARDEYQELDVEAYIQELDGMAKEARAYVRGSLEARVAGLSRYLFHEMGFHGNTRHYYDPRNSYLNQVLDRRTGIPLTLSLLTMAIGQRCDLEIVGVGLPGHFVAKAVGEGEEILFDPFHGGRQLGAADCETLVYQVTGEAFTATETSLRALPIRLVVLRMLTNLKAVYLRSGAFDKAVRVIGRLRQLCPEDPLQIRDLGVCLLQSGKPGRAIDCLKEFLAAAPTKEDAETVERLISDAYKELGRWN